MTPSGPPGVPGDQVIQSFASELPTILAVQRTQEQLVAGANRRARTRPTFKDPITVEDVLNSCMIAYPLLLLQCCLATDGGGTSAERANHSRKSRFICSHRRECRDADGQPSPVIPAKAGIRGVPGGSGGWPGPAFAGGDDGGAYSRAFRVAGPKAFAEAGITHTDVDH